MSSRAWSLSAATAVWACVVLVAGLSTAPLPVTRLAPDTVWHGLSYLLLAALATGSVIEMTGGRWTAAAALAAVVFAVGHGAVLEGLQSLTATRTAELRDLAADAAGAVTGAVVTALLRSRA